MDDTSHQNWDVKFLVVATMQDCSTSQNNHYCKKGLCMQQQRTAPKTTGCAASSLSTLQRLYPPAGFPKGESIQTAKWSLTSLPETTLKKNPENEVITTIELLHCSRHIILTDVSKKDVPQLAVGFVTGSGVYRQPESAQLELKVHSAGQGMLNTITSSNTGCSSSGSEGTRLSLSNARSPSNADRRPS